MYMYMHAYIYVIDIDVKTDIDIYIYIYIYIYISIDFRAGPATVQGFREARSAGSEASNHKFSKPRFARLRGTGDRGLPHEIKETSQQKFASATAGGPAPLKERKVARKISRALPLGVNLTFRVKSR